MTTASSPTTTTTLRDATARADHRPGAAAGPRPRRRRDCGPARGRAKLAGVSKVLRAEGDEALAHQLAEPLAALVVSLAPAYDALVAPATTSGKNVMPRVAALLDVMQVSDIIKVVSPDTFERPIYAGNAIQTVQSTDAKKVITVRTAAFRAAGEGAVKPRAPPASRPSAGNRDLGRPTSPGAHRRLRRARLRLGRELPSRAHRRQARRRHRREPAAVVPATAERPQVGQTGKAARPLHRLRHLRHIQHLAAEGREGHRRHRRDAEHDLQVADCLVGDLFSSCPSSKAPTARPDGVVRGATGLRARSRPRPEDASRRTVPKSAFRSRWCRLDGSPTRSRVVELAGDSGERRRR